MLYLFLRKLSSEVSMRYILIITIIPSILFAASHIENKIDYSEVHSVYQSMNCFDEKTEKKMDECGIQSLKSAKEKMNLIFNILISNSISDSQSRRNKIKNSQENWSHYMKSSCVMESLDSEGGSGYNSIINFCYETKVNERISYLQWILSNK